MQLVSCTTEHFRAIKAQPAQAEAAARASDYFVGDLRKAGAYAIVDEEGVWCVGGIVDMGEGRAIAWCLLDKSVPYKLPAVHRIVKRVIDGAPYRRIELVADTRCTKADEWAIRLGFDFEAPLRAYFPDGSAAHLYSRIRHA
jgi:hypothetical protein